MNTGRSAQEGPEGTLGESPPVGSQSSTRTAGVRGISDNTVAYADQLLAEVLEHAEEEDQEAFLSDAFADLVLDDLEQDGRWPDYQLSHFETRGARVDGWGLDDERRILHLAIADFSRTTQSLSLPRGELGRLVNRLAGFLSRARKGTIEVQDHNPVADLLDVVNSRDRYDTVSLYVLTHRVAATADLPEIDIDGLQASTRVWDLETIRRFRETGTRLEPIDVDLLQRFGSGLPYLDGNGSDGVRTLLLFIPGSQLASIYQEHGGRLLERNVRSFLSVRGKINKGLRDTLRLEPERFLAYNNGLTATAAAIESATVNGVPTVTTIRDLQVVNGGQTTASIANAARERDVDLADVMVQMKLVVVEGELLDEMVPNISKYANRQNAVQESDLSANNDFLRGLEAASRTEWTPAAATGRPTKWYFERARGSFDVDLGAAGSPAQQKRFLAESPKPQKFGKNDIALYENTWNRLPHIVCRGGQKNFAEFMLRHPHPPDGADDSELDAWHRDQFRELVAKAILFKTADKAVRAEHGGTYKRAVVSYTLAWLLQFEAVQPDLSAVWRTQQADPAFVDAVVQVAGQLKEELMETANGRNITEWAKHEACWKTLADIDFEYEYEAKAAAEEIRHVPSVEKVWSEPGRRLADLIERHQGEAIEGRYRRYRRSKWRYRGDSLVLGAHGETLHVYSAPMRDGSGRPYIFTVVVDFPARQILSLQQLEPDRALLVETWLSQLDEE